MMKMNDRGNDVKALQKKLGINTDGIFGRDTEAAVKKFQKSHGLTADGIAGPKTLAALGLATAHRRLITEIVVHCEATPEGEEFSRDVLEHTHKIFNFTPYAIDGRVEHIGYHYVVHLDGTVEPCRPESVAGCHCKGHNPNSIGVSYVGGCPPRTEERWMYKAKDTRTPEQKAALVKLLKELKAKYPNAKIYGHRDFANKPCPCFDAKTEYKNL